jgi:mannose-6-phosphate isomerase-like protein (cupin superfamily)
MPATVIDLADLRTGPGAPQFEGARHADGAGLSFFVNRPTRERGPDAHTHAYAEVFVVLGGRVRFTVDGEDIEAHADQVVVVPPGAVHGFKGLDDEPGLMLSLHDAAEMRTEWL